jgi:hypothetical protein
VKQVILTVPETEQIMEAGIHLAKPKIHVKSI